MPLTSFGPWQSHLDPPSVPGYPTVAIFDDIWGDVGVILDLTLETEGVFLDACRLQELKKEGSGRHSEPEALFSSILGSATSAQEGSLQRELCFHFGGQWQENVDFGLHFGVILGAQSSTILTLGSP